MIRAPHLEFGSQASGQTQRVVLARLRRFRGKADIDWSTRAGESVENDPKRTSDQRRYRNDRSGMFVFPDLFLWAVGCWPVSTPVA